MSVGADGSLRAFDLRSLEHSTILYETPAPKGVLPPPGPPSPSTRPLTQPLLRICFNPHDSNYMATFHVDGTNVQILDMRSPGQPVMELTAHQSPVTAARWSTSERPLLATAGEVLSHSNGEAPLPNFFYTGDDCQLLLWDLTGHTTAPATSPRNASSRLNSPRPDTKKRIISDPVMAYTSGGEISNMAWSPYMNSMTLNTGHSTGPGEWLVIAMGREIQALKV